MSELQVWDCFYVIIGSAAGALIGLQFVVVTLVAEKPSLRATEAGAVIQAKRIHDAPTAFIQSLSATVTNVQAGRVGHELKQNLEHAAVPFLGAY